MTEQYPAVAVVLLNWNGKDFLEKFLPSVCASTYPHVKIYLADNDSSDDSVAFVKAHYPTIQIVLNEVNAGFAAGYNMALGRIQADYYVLLNQDVEVTAGWIEPVINMMESDKTIAACQPKILAYHQKDRFEYAGAAGGFIDRWGYPFCRGRLFDTVEEDKHQYDLPVKVFWASGAAMFVRAELYHRAGGLDAGFFAHMEEIDLCWRLQRMGYRIWVCPQSVVYHVGGGSLPQGNPRKTFLNFRNNLMMLHKNLHGSARFTVIFGRLALDGVAGIKSLLTGKTATLFAIIKAHWCYFRWVLKRNGNVSPEKIPAVPAASLKGYYPRSLVWQYFFKGKKQFSSLEDGDK